MKLRASQRHFVAAWNPRFRPDAVESHVDCFLAAAEEARRGAIDSDDVYVYWGKIRSPSRHETLPHLDQILGVDDECDYEAEPDREVHLYITDYHSLLVAHVGEVTDSDIRELEGERKRFPSYYLDPGVEVDCWFKLFDIRRLATDDQFAVIDELEKLRNTRHFDRPVSIYGGMVDLPLIVTRPDGTRFFEPGERCQLTDGKHWAEFDAERVGLGQMERELRENIFGDAAWRALEPTTRLFIATAEKVFRDHRSDAAFDFTPVVVEFAKALEVQCNGILRRALANVPERSRHALVDGRTVDVAKDGALTLVQLANAIAEEQELNRILKMRLRNGEWFTSQLPPLLREIARWRNPAAHSKRLHREEVLPIRDRLMGVGCAPDLAQLAAVSPIDEQGHRFTPRYARSVS
jgi:hypothetical protein